MTAVCVCSEQQSLPPTVLILRGSAAELPAEMNEAANPGTMEAALLDLALLSTCDDMVVTVASSFGWVAGTQMKAFI